MATAEVVEREEQRHCRFMVRPFFRVSIGQAREAANLHPQRLVRAFDVARANPIFVRIAEPGSSDNVNHRSRGITPIVLRLAVDLDQRGEVYPPAQDRGNRRAVRRETICRQLEASARREEKIVREDRRIGGRALTDVPRQDEFRMPLNRREAPNVADAIFGQAATNPGALLHRNEPPDFVALNVSAFNVMDLLLHEAPALLAGLDHRADDRVAPDVIDALLGANATAFQDLIQDREHRCRIDAALVLRARFLVRESLLALIAPIALRSVPVEAEPTSSTLASRTKHNRTTLPLWERFG